VKAFLDTHAALALYFGRTEEFEASAELLERAVLRCSPVVRLELGLLREIGRIDPSPDEVLGALASDCGVGGRRMPSNGWWPVRCR